MALSRRRADLYGSMTELLRDIPQDGNYDSLAEESRNSRVRLFAPHGGCIEPGTDRLVVALASNEFDFYLFRGIRMHECYRTLHVTSAQYDEPGCVRMATGAMLAVSIHGCDASEELIEVGGGNLDAASSLREHLIRKHYPAVLPQKHRQGEEPANFINLAKHRGVQLELTAGFRSMLFPGFPRTDQRDPRTFNAFITDIREWLLLVERAPADTPYFPIRYPV